jgi:mono/diheme cytochrome c family protein
MRISTLLIFVLAFAALIYLALEWRSGTIEGNSYETPREHGAMLFVEYCADCHREDGSGARLSVKSEDQFRGALIAGNYPMPSFDGELSDQEMDALWAYVSSLSPSDGASP